MSGEFNKPTSWTTSKKSVRSRSWNVPDPIEKRPRDETTQKTSVNNVEAKAVNLSECWTGTTRFQIRRTRLLERNKWVSGRPSKFKTRLDSIWPGAWTQLPKNQKKKHEIKEWENKIPSFKQHTHKESYEVSTDDKDYLKVNAADVRS